MERIAVTIHSPDPLSRAGVESFLRRQPGVELRDPTTRGPGPVERHVVVLIVDELDETATHLLGQLSACDHHVVLAAGRLREPEFATALAAGVRVVVWRRELDADRLARAIRSAANRVYDLPPDLVGRMLARVAQLQFQQQSRSGPPPSLSPREIEVLRLLAEGLETREVAERMAYSERTIKSILHRLITRLRLRNRTHAVAYALRRGYL